MRETLKIYAQPICWGLLSAAFGVSTLATYLTGNRSPDLIATGFVSFATGVVAIKTCRDIREISKFYNLETLYKE